MFLAVDPYDGVRVLPVVRRPRFVKQPRAYVRRGTEFREQNIIPREAVIEFPGEWHNGKAIHA